MEPKKEIIQKFESLIADELQKIGATDCREDDIIKFDVLVNMYKVLENYDELKPILVKFFDERKFKNVTSTNGEERRKKSAEDEKSEIAKDKIAVSTHQGDER